MDKDYQECMICGEEDIGGDKIYVPRYSKKSKENPARGRPFKNFNTQNLCKDWESNTQPRDLGEGYSLALKEVICMSNHTSNKSIESTTAESETRKTEPEKLVTNLEESWNDTKYRQVWTHQILL